MSFDLDLPQVRSCAATLSDLGARVSSGAGHAPDPPRTPRWATTDAMDALLTTVVHETRAAGGEIDSAGRRIAAIADDYESADGRAARRLRDTRWR